MPEAPEAVSVGARLIPVTTEVPEVELEALVNARLTRFPVFPAPGLYEAAVILIAPPVVKEEPIVILRFFSVV